MEKIGAFLCTGCDIGRAVDVGALQEVAEEHGASSWVAHPCLCSPAGLEQIRGAVASDDIDGLLLLACSMRAKVKEFRGVSGDICVVRVSLREQVAWSHPHGEEDTQLLAEDLLRMGLARLAKSEKAEPPQDEIDKAVMVVGGGLTGLTAARAVSGLGYPAVIVEASEQLGGYLAGLRDFVPQSPPYDQLHPNPIAELVRDVTSDAAITVHTGSKIQAIDGQPGQFSVDIETESGRQSFGVGAIVQATGARPYDASRLEHLGYGTSASVLTSEELDQMLAEGGALTGEPGKDAPLRVAFVQCAGSRDENHLPYCSTECCATTLRQVFAIHRSHPDVECTVIYRDLRAPGQLEHFLLAVQEQSACTMIRGTVTAVSGNGNGSLAVQLSTSLLGDHVELDADVVVLATGMCPTAADGEAIRELRDARARIVRNESETQVKAAQEVVNRLEQHEGTEILNLGYRQGPDLPVLGNTFPDSHYICFPYETRRTGIYAAGAVRAPMDAAQAAVDGWGAAQKAVQSIISASRGEAVHPRVGDSGIADFFMQRCTSCKRCTEECPFGSIDEDDKGTPKYNRLRCRRCGICLGACPERIISFPDYSVDAVATMIKAIEVPDEDEEKPRILAFMCENDALPALDEAAARRLQWNAWIRVVPVRCLGAVNTVWIADALSSGIDGVLLLGCKRGDDYQCHYIRGSELANTRMSNVKETLDRLTLESERIRLVEIARNDVEQIPQVFDEFCQTLEEVGPNPYKGF